MSDIEAELRSGRFWSNIAEMKYTDTIVILFILMALAFSALCITKKLKDQWDFKTAIAVRSIIYLPVALLMYIGYDLGVTLIGLIILAGVELISHVVILKGQVKR